MNFENKEKQKPEFQVSDVQWFYYAGGIFIILAMFFLYREFSIDAAWLLSIATIGFGVLSIRRWPTVAPFVAPICLGLCCLISTGLWYDYQGDSPHTLPLMASVAVSAAMAVAAIFLGRGQGVPTTEALQYHRAAQWYAMTLSTMAGSWTVYQEVLTYGRAAGEDYSGPRRMILTLGWILVGVGMVWFSIARNQRYLKHAGIAFTAVAFAKALLYDTHKMESFWRIGVFVLGGVVLMGMGYVLQNAQKKELQS